VIASADASGCFIAEAPVILVSLECGDWRGGDRHGRHQQRIEAGRPHRDPRDGLALF